MAEPESTQQKGAFVTHPLQAETPRRSPLRRKIIGAAFLIIVLWFMTIGMRWRASLASAVDSADRVLISNRYVAPDDDLKNPIEVIGPDAVAELLRLIEIDRLSTLTGYVVTCKCIGTPLIEFRNGHQKLARIAIGHHVRWQNGAWPHDAWLTSQSEKAIAKWWADQLPPVSQWKSILQQAVTDADRIVISTPRELSPVSVVIRDAKTILEFLNAIEVDEQKTIPNQLCKCVGEVEVAFYEGEYRVEALWFFRDNLKWLGGLWSGDVTLTQQSRSNLETWLKDRANFVVPQKEASRGP